MTGLMQRIFRRRSSGPSRRGVAGLVPRLPAGLRRRRSARTGLPWGKRAEQPALTMGSGAPATEVVETAGTASFRDRGRLRRRLRYLRRARELAFRDVGGLIFDMRRFGRDRPDLVEAKIGALAAVDQELRALERVLDDRRPIHELREPGLSSCPRCGALHASEDNFCPHCGLQFGGPQAMGEVGGAIAAPPQAPQAVEQATSPALIAPGAAAGATPAASAAAEPPAASAAGVIRIADGSSAATREASAVDATGTTDGAAAGPPSDETIAGRAADGAAAAGDPDADHARGDGTAAADDSDAGAPPPASGDGSPTVPAADGDAPPAPAEAPQPTEILRPPDAS
ncbi:MAG: hypothetical protein QOE31_4011 [Solirubrobacteraceae bacterium]|jgi:hypothetical protein|nr:hypothetical protein [Solirubrobacteraceae bacterium]